MVELRILKESDLEDWSRFIDSASDLIVAHYFYRGSRAPARRVFGNGDELAAYVRKEGRIGDCFYCWSFEECCTPEQVKFSVIVPDVDGKAPDDGVY
ncbi:hypothetical protein [Corallococcus terminator]|uniref:Uncharacterized protein n=1 Tax=Corallococcus terminator TaxID=2316733 RepID=A0A3A8J7U7_9BACT|nr:hypothetical protein [Corallococcus terminator]RKG91118.1 hypothetical protein D7V88_09930 [Corallococcus terminator]